VWNDKEGEAMTDAAHPANRARTRAAIWGVIPVGLTLGSVVGLVQLFILDAADYGESGVWDDVFWVMFSFGGILGLLTGAAAYVVGRRGRDDQARWEWSESGGSRSRSSSSSSSRR
jgi:hypothetical protein